MTENEVIKKLHDALTKHHKLGLAQGAVYQRGKLCDESLMALVAARSLPMMHYKVKPVLRNLNPVTQREKKS